ncbi:MAG TPA: FAD-dependent oxidoreductase [Longimicrobiales bacterium]|nr:FAD-dependent oxidoreductase [Longimicrobiales bacterium]
MSRRLPAVAVIGGGVIGLAVAWRLARRGVPVVLLERHQPGAGASSAAAGMLSPLKEAGEPGPFLDLGLRSLARYPEFVREVESCAGMEVGYRRDGRLDLAFTDDAVEALRHQRLLQEEAGHESRLLDPAELRRLEPGVADDVRLGLATELDHQVDNARLVRALWLAAEREGVEIRTAAGAAAVLTGAPEGPDGAARPDEPGAARPARSDESLAPVTGVRLDSGDVVPADAVVVAAGAWTGGLALPRPIPIRPVRGQIVVLRMVPPAPRRVTWGPGCYLVPRCDGRLLVGATMEEAGFAIASTAGATRSLLDCAIRVLPSLADARLEGFQVGLRPASRDGFPVIGADPATPGLFFATGHFRNGILLAPETAEMVAAELLDGRAADTAFSPARFGAAGA